MWPTLWKRLARFFPPRDGDALAEHIQHTVWASALAIGAISLCALLASLAGLGRLIGLTSPLIEMAGAVAALGLARMGRFRTAGVGLIASIVVGPSLGLVREGTLDGPGAFALAILLAGLLFGLRGVLLLTFLMGPLLIGLHASFETALAAALRAPGAPDAVILFWLGMALLVGVIASLSVGKLLRQAAEARRSQRALADSESRYRSVIENAPLGVVLFDASLRITAINPEACRIIHSPAPSEMIGRPATELPIYAMTEVREGFERVLTHAERVSFEADWKSSFGARVRCRLYGAPLLDSRGRTRGAVVLMADVSEQKKLEEQLFQAQKMEAVGRLAGGIAHDFNNQLTVILSAAELLSTSVDAALAGDVDQIVSSAKRSAALTQQLLAYGRRQLLRPTTLDLNGVVAEMDPLLRRTLGAGIEIETVLAAGLWPTCVDRAQVQSALLNLAVNARDAMEGRGRLTLETANVHIDRRYAQGHDVPPGQYVMLAVTDDGAGMNEEARARAFEPFYTTKPSGEGTGLGLSMVHGFVRQSGGLINVYSEPGQGTTFRIYLPRAEGPAESGPDEERVATARGGSERLLVAEDDPAVRGMIVRVLRREGYEVHEAEDGESAAALAARLQAFDLLVSDLVMPRLGGIELARRLQAERPELRVLYLSGYAENGALRRAGLRLGTTLLAKPFSPSELLERVREVLDG